MLGPCWALWSHVRAVLNLKVLGPTSFQWRAQLTINMPCCRWHAEAGTRVLILENVVTGTIQQLSCAELERLYDIHLIHAATEDSGYGAHKRYRGWRLSLQLNKSLLTSAGFLFCAVLLFFQTRRCTVLCVPKKNQY